MTLLELLQTQPELSADILLWMLSLTVKAGVIVGLALVTTIVFRRATSARLHLTLLTAVVAALLLPVMGLIFPEWQPGLLKDLPTLSTGLIFAGDQLRTVDGVDVEHAAAIPWPFWPIIVWAAGAAFFLSRTIIGLFATARLVRRATTVSDTRLNSLYDVCRDVTGTRRQIRLAVSPEITSPFVWGIFRPVIILPEVAQTWPDRDIRYALLHELAHIRRFDSLWLVIVAVAFAVHWVNPLIWLARKRLIIEAEKTCDDCVLHSGADGSEYAQHLVRILGMLRDGRGVIPVGIGMARRSHMEGRLMSILSNRKRSVGLGKSLIVLAALATLLLAFPLAGLQVQAQEKTETIEEKVPDPDESIKTDKGPEMIYQEAPVYPEEAKEAKIEGTVWIKALVDKKGNVVKAMVHKSSGHEILDDSALKTAHKNKFKPAMQGENPVMVWITYKVSFVLDEDKEDKEKGNG
ncbi:MAG: M56 family metallopeptidase [Candidatus Zixiibacteriota bacterium]|nr:MAG: M56 family metallopeptidase [candidate division Zixibacteria bacterium]